MESIFECVCAFTLREVKFEQVFFSKDINALYRGFSGNKLKKSLEYIQKQNKTR